MIPTALALTVMLGAHPSEAHPPVMQSPVSEAERVPATHTAYAALPDAVTVLAQTGAGLGVLIAAAPGLVAFPILGSVALPFLVAYAETWVGDKLSARRAAVLWPAVVSYAACGALAGGVALRVLEQPLQLSTAAGHTGTALLVAGGAGFLAIPLAYALTATPKDPDDDGTEPPDFVKPRR